jgi:phosphate/sulfate permease
MYLEVIMDGKKPKEGVSVKEIEAFAKQHRFEVFFCLAFVLACFFTFVMWGAAWSIFATIVGAIIGVLLTAQVAQFSKMVFQFVFKHEKTTQMVLAIVTLVLAIGIPPLIFLIIGLHGGKDLHHWAQELYHQKSR